MAAEHVLLTLPISELQIQPLLAPLQQAHPSWTFTFVHAEINQSTIPPEHLKDVTILYTFSACPAALADAPALKWIALWNAGISPYVSTPFLTASPIPWTTSNGTNAPAIAELVVAAEQSHRRHLRSLAARDSWLSKAEAYALFGTQSSIGRRVGIFGYGAIGRHVARYVAAGGAKVVAYTARPRPTPASRADDAPCLPGMGDPAGELPVEWFSGTAREDVHKFLGADLDWVVFSVPLTEQTRGLIGPAELQLLGRRRAFLTTIADGALVHTDALVAALKPGPNGAPSLLAGAHLDVTDPMPLPDGHELWSMDHVLVTPHIAAMINDWIERTFGLFREQLGRWARGETLVNLVDKKAGY